MTFFVWKGSSHAEQLSGRLPGREVRLVGQPRALQDGGRGGGGGRRRTARLVPMPALPPRLGSAPQRRPSPPVTGVSAHRVTVSTRTFSYSYSCSPRRDGRRLR